MDYRDNQHLYKLSFVSSKDSKDGMPHLVFSMEKRHLEVFQERLFFIIPRFKKNSETYFRTDSEFAFPNKDLFGNYTFGYNNCGYMDIDEEEVHFHFELRSNANSVSFTIWFLLTVFNSMFADKVVVTSKRWQFIQLDTMCQVGLHGHSMGGSISPDLGKWLKKQSESVPNESAFSKVELLEAEEVMLQVYESISDQKLIPRECRALIAHDGRFSLMCPGDACDVSIYPDQLSGDEIGTRSVKFDCHNLDNAVQQLTLLAGLAKLCELARNDE